MIDAAGIVGKDPADALRDGSAMDHWRRMISAQGGNPDAALPVAKEGKGFEFSMRNVTTRIPLRTARALKLMGMDIEGNIHACGVEQVKNHHIDIQTGTESCSHGKVGHKCCCCTALLAPYSKTCTHGRNSFCCCCAAVRLREDDKNLNDMLNSLE